jgi:hypothetical protein
MSVIDKVIAAVTPPESEKDRAEAREKALACAQPGDWLSLILEHHLELEAALAAVEDATAPKTEPSLSKSLRCFSPDTPSPRKL